MCPRCQRTLQCLLIAGPLQCPLPTSSLKSPLLQSALQCLLIAGPLQCPLPTSSLKSPLLQSALQCLLVAGPLQCPLPTSSLKSPLLLSVHQNPLLQSTPQMLWTSPIKNFCGGGYMSVAGPKAKATETPGPPRSPKPPASPWRPPVSPSWTNLQGAHPPSQVDMLQRRMCLLGGWGGG